MWAQEDLAKLLFEPDSIRQKERHVWRDHAGEGKQRGLGFRVEGSRHLNAFWLGGHRKSGPLLREPEGGNPSRFYVVSALTLQGKPA